MKKFIEQYKKHVLIGAAVVVGTTAATSQVVHARAIEEAQSIGAIGTADKYGKQGIFVRPSTIDKIEAESVVEVEELAVQANEIINAEAAFQMAVEEVEAMETVATEDETLAGIVAKQNEAKTLYNEFPTLEAGEVYLASLSEAQTAVGTLVNGIEKRSIEDALASMTVEEMESRFEGYLNSVIQTFEHHENFPPPHYMPKMEETYNEVLSIEGEYLDSKNALLKNPSNEAEQVHKELMVELYIDLFIINTENYIKGGFTSTDEGSLVKFDKPYEQTPETCEETAVILGVTSIPGCETLEADGLVGFDWIEFGEDPFTNNPSSYILISTKNYSYAWYSYTGKWTIWDTDTWDVIDTGIQNFSSTINITTFEEYRSNWEAGNPNNYNGVTEEEVIKVEMTNEEYKATITPGEAEYWFERFLEGLRLYVADTTSTGLPKDEEMIAEVKAIEEEYYASKDALGENPSDEAMKAHGDLMEELYVEMFNLKVEAIAKVYFDDKITGKDSKVQYNYDNQTPKTCAETAEILGVESIPGCETLETDGLVGFEWVQEAGGVVYNHPVTAEPWEYILIASENYGFVWCTKTGSWSIWEIRTWELIDSGVQEFSSTINYEIFQGYIEAWRSGSPNNYNGVTGE